MVKLKNNLGTFRNHIKKYNVEVKIKTSLHLLSLETFITVLMMLIW